VTIDRDRTPEIPKRFNVAAYPSVLVLGAADENVHRFQGFAKKEVHRARLEEALRRHALYREGKPWDAPDPRPAAIAEGEGVSSLPAPSDEIPGGIAALGEDLWVAQGERILRLDPATGKVRGEIGAGGGVAGIAARGDSLWLLPFDWTAGGAIRVLDPSTGKTLCEVVTEGNRKNRHSGAKGIAWHGDRLFVLEGMEGRIRELDPATGAVRATLETKRTWLGGLASDGRHLLTAGGGKLLRIDPDSGAIARERPLNYGVRCLGFREGAVLLMEQPEFGFGRSHERIQVRPRAGETRLWSLRED
jgi:hypothetical protein